MLWKIEKECNSNFQLQIQALAPFQNRAIYTSDFQHTPYRVEVRNVLVAAIFEQGLDNADERAAKQRKKRPCQTYLALHKGEFFSKGNCISNN